MVEMRQVDIPQKILRFLAIVVLGLAIALGLPHISVKSAEAPLPEHAIARPLQRGTDLYQAGRFAEAVTVWQQAVTTLETSGPSLDLALVLGHLSAAYQDLGHWTEADTAVNQSLAILATVAQESEPRHHSAILAKTLNHQGHLFWLKGQLEAAVDVWQQSALAYGNAQDETGVLGSLINQAKALQVLGLSIQSETLLQRVSERLGQTVDPGFKATGLRHLGNALRRVGKLEAARETLVESLSLTNTPGGKSAVWLALGNTDRALGNRARALGKTSEAQTFTQSALANYGRAAAGGSPQRQIRAQLNQFGLLVQMGEQANALKLLPAIKTSLQMLPPGRTAVYARLNLAQNLMCANTRAVSCQPSRLQRRRVSQRPGEILLVSRSRSVDTPSLKPIGELLATALEQAQQLADPLAQSHALGLLGELYEQTQQWPEARSLTEQALAMAEPIRAPELRYRWEWQLGRLLEANGDQVGAIAAYGRSINELKAARNDLLLVDPEVQFSFRDNGEPVYRRLISLLVSPTQNQPPSQASLRQAIQTIDDLQLAELENYLGCNLDQRVQLIDNNVDPTAAIFHIITLPEQLAVILKLPDSEDVLLHTIPVAKQSMDATFKSLKRELGKTYPSPEGKVRAQQVYDWVIRPVESLLSQHHIETLVFVLDGALRSVPMAALYDGQHYLIEKFAIALTPNSQLFIPKPLSRNNLQVQSFGISDFQSDNPDGFPHHQNFGDLPYVTEELQQLQQYASGNEFLNNQFTRSALETQILDSSPIVHIATHGQFSSDPRETFIVAWDEQIDVFSLSSILRTHQENGSTPIEMLVLSACQTAVGDDRAVLGLAGIAIQSGARSTLSSLWVIQDQSTAILMELFYQALNDPSTPVTRAEALRQAQLQLMKIPGYVAPYYWAPYVMVGGWL